MKRIGIMTGGGDAPGLNGIIESVSRALLLKKNYELVGICDGFEGVFEGRTRPITWDFVNGLHAEAGTALGTTNKVGTKGHEKEFRERFDAMKLDGLIVAGGDGTFEGLKRVASGIPLIGIPKTIDNDLHGTEVTFGFDTACAVVAESIDSLRTTANSHKRVIIVETMGRTAGWIALGGGLASYADAILIPERPFDRTELLNYLRAKKNAGMRGLIIAASEGAHAKGENVKVAFKVQGSPEADRLGGIAESLARWIDKELGWESRHVVLGHLQRARHPTTTDRFLTLAMGVEAARMVEEGKWGMATVYNNGRIERAPIETLMQPARLVDANHRWVRLAQSIGLFI